MSTPTDRARDLGDGEIALIHSTSWRWERTAGSSSRTSPGRRTAASRSARVPLPGLTPPGPTDPLHPRPAEIRELDPLAHGLRHLAFLLRTSRDGAVAAALGPRAAAVLARLEPTSPASCRRSDSGRPTREMRLKREATC